MGNFNIKHKLIRCEKCFCIRRITIEPKYPQTEILLECRCEPKKINIQYYISELHKNELYKLKCGECGKEDPKSVYCNNCSYILCSNCFKNHQSKFSSNPHITISASKFEFYCLEHQNEPYTGFCQTCEENICKNCAKNQKHSGHKMIPFKKIISEKLQKNKLQREIGFIKDKLEYNEKVTILILKKEKTETTKKNIRIASETNSNINKNIFEIIQFLIYILEHSKNQNYSIIRNLLKNTNFNLQKLRFQKNTTVDQDSAALLNYFENDFILNVINDKDKTIREETTSIVTDNDDDFINERATTMLYSQTDAFMNMFEVISMDDIESPYKNNVNNKKDNKNKDKKEEKNLRLGHADDDKIYRHEKIPRIPRKSKNIEDNIKEEKKEEKKIEQKAEKKEEKKVEIKEEKKIEKKEIKIEEKKEEKKAEKKEEKNKEKEVIKQSSEVNKNVDFNKKEKEKEVACQGESIKYNKFIEQIWAKNRKKVNGKIVEKLMIRSKIIS